MSSLYSSPTLRTSYAGNIVRHRLVEFMGLVNNAPCPVEVVRESVTLTTVGYGDLSPHTPFGQMVASIVMIIGYGIIAVPTGIVSVELAHAARQQNVSSQSCPSCAAEGYDPDARMLQVLRRGLVKK